MGETVVCAATGVTQQELAENAKYIIGVGLVLADDFLAHVGKESLAKIDTKAAYIVRINKPIPAWFFLYGVSVALIPEGGCAKITYPSKSFAEHWALSNMMQTLDPEGRYKLRTEHMFVDLNVVDGRIVQIPKDEDIVRLHIASQDTHSGAANKPKRASWQLASSGNHPKKPTMAMELRMSRGLRSLDRRRYIDAGFMPPLARMGDLKKIQAAIGKKMHADPTIDDTDNDIDDDAADVPGAIKWKTENKAKDLLGKILFVMDARPPPVVITAEDDMPPINTILGETAAEAEEDLFGNCGDFSPPSSEMTGVSESANIAKVLPLTQQPVAVLSRKKASRKPKKTSLQAVLK